jgi:hypothetical protein
MSTPREIVLTATGTTGSPRGVNITLNNQDWAYFNQARFTIVTDATVGNRLFHMQIADASGTVFYDAVVFSGNTIAASLTTSFQGYAGLDGNVQLPPKAYGGLLLPPLSVARIYDANNIASAADTVAGVVILSPFTG